VDSDGDIDVFVSHYAIPANRHVSADT
jgi:hypothetical protein